MKMSTATTDLSEHRGGIGDSRWAASGGLQQNAEFSGWIHKGKQHEGAENHTVILEAYELKKHTTCPKNTLIHQKLTTYTLKQDTATVHMVESSYCVPRTTKQP
jgi:hypothetical protein